MQQLQTPDKTLNDALPGESPSKKIKENPSALTSLKEHTIVVADSGKIQEIEKFKPHDATTNPSLILEAVKLPEYKEIVDNAIKKGIINFQQKQIQVQTARRGPKRKTKHDETPEPQQKVDEEPFDYKKLDNQHKKEVVEMICDQLCVNFGTNILKLIPGYVSTEVDARLSFDKQATIDRAKRIIALYEEEGVKRDRILIKIASTWEGIEAAKALRKEKILCNMTLIFNFYQAIACAQAQVRLISPFVGRILDWFKKDKPDADFKKEKDPGVQLVTRIWSYFKKYKHDTIVMAASFRTMEETQYLAGCDRMTIPLKILGELQDAQSVTFAKMLNQEIVDKYNEEKVLVDEKRFRWELNNDAMGNEKLAEGIKKFAIDIDTLEKIVNDRLLQQ